MTNFRGLKCNKLYILDNAGEDPRGSYYLGKNRDFFIERGVVNLIEDIIKFLNISNESVICAGSSKGGYASLYYAFKYGYGISVIGAPQVLLGNFIANSDRENLLTYISGGDKKEDVEFTNNILTNTIRKSLYKPKVYIHVSKNEYHYEEHVLPLIKLFDRIDYKYDLNLGNYKTHGEVGIYYSMYAKKIIREKTK